MAPLIYVSVNAPLEGSTNQDPKQYGFDQIVSLHISQIKYEANKLRNIYELGSY